MTRRELMERICEITREATGAALSETESLKESGLDSLALVTVIAGIEERFWIFFRDDDLDPGTPDDVGGIGGDYGEIHMRLWEYLKEKMLRYADRTAFAGTGLTYAELLRFDEIGGGRGALTVCGENTRERSLQGKY